MKSPVSKNQKNILDKLGIAHLNPMQEEAKFSIHSRNEVILLSPTGTGKTLAFLLPILAELDHSINEVQCLIVVPSRELAIQIEQVTRDIGSGFKANAVYGGRHFSKDKIDINHRPAILIGTPGRVADHLRRQSFNTKFTSFLVLDEFDKSLEIGFHDEMEEILNFLPEVKKKILTSATNSVEVPHFVKLLEPVIIDYLDKQSNNLKIKRILSPSKDKLETLGQTLNHLGSEPGIIFCNFKDSIRRVSDFLNSKMIDHGTFYGGMEQKERERALIKFRNGSHRILIATDLAARGLDIPELKFIIHYHLPLKEEEFTHRNGRTARMHAEGTAYVLQWEEEELPEFINAPEIEKILPAPSPEMSEWETLFISGGRKDKISKGDIAGFLMKQGNLSKNEVGKIELKQDCAFVAVNASRVQELIHKLNNSRIKKRKVILYTI